MKPRTHDLLAFLFLILCLVIWAAFFHALDDALTLTHTAPP